MDTLNSILQRLDAAMNQHAQHGAMPVSDPLIDSLYGQLEGPAAEGAQAPGTADSGLTPAQREALAALDADPWWPALLALGLVGGAMASAMWPWGVA